MHRKPCSTSRISRVLSFIGVMLCACFAILAKPVPAFAGTNDRPVTIVEDNFAGLPEYDVMIDGAKLGNWTSSGCNASIENNALGSSHTPSIATCTSIKHNLFRYMQKSNDRALQIKWVAANNYAAKTWIEMSGSITMRFKNVAILDGGTKGDLLVTISNIKMYTRLAITKGNTYYWYPLFGTTGGTDGSENYPAGLGTLSTLITKAIHDGTATGGNNQLLAQCPSETMSWLVTCKVVKSGTTTQLGTKTLASFYDIDQPGRPSQDVLPDNDVQYRTWTNASVCEGLFPNTGFTETDTINGKVNTVLHAKKNTLLVVGNSSDESTWKAWLAHYFVHGTSKVDDNVTEKKSMTGFKSVVSTGEYTYVWHGTRCFTYLISKPDNPTIKLTVGKGGTGKMPKSTTTTGVTTVTGGSNKTLTYAYDNPNAYTFSWTPSTGYKTSSLTVDGESVSVTSSKKFLMPTIDHTIDVKFSPISYTVRYDPNATDATGTTGTSVDGYDTQRAITSKTSTATDTTLSYDTTYYVELNGYTRPGYKFIGYSLTPTGTVKYGRSEDGINKTESFNNLTTTDGGIVTLYAQWIPADDPIPTSWNIVFDKNAEDATGTTEDMLSLDFGESYELTENGFERDGYTWVGWKAEDPDNGADYGDKVSVSSDSFNLDSQSDDGTTITMYAQWKPWPKVKVKKEPASEIPAGNTELSLAGAVYSVKSGTESVGSLVTNESGDTEAISLAPGNYIIQEETPSPGFLLDQETYDVTLGNDDEIKTVTSKEPMSPGEVTILKKSASPDLTDGNNSYSLEGASYGLYSDSECANLVATITTDENGEGAAQDVAAGNYWVKEITASTGFDLDTKVYPISAIPGGTVNVESEEPAKLTGIQVSKTATANGSPNTTTKFQFRINIEMPHRAPSSGDDNTPDDGGDDTGAGDDGGDNEDDSEQEGDGTISLTGDFGDVTLTDGIGTFELAGGDSVSISGLPIGCAYRIEETDIDGWMREPNNGVITGTTGSEVATAAFTNTYDSNDLIVKKLVEGNGAETEKAFSFTVSLTKNGSPVSGTYGDVTFSNGTATFQLRHNQQKVISDIPSGYAYSVSEQEDANYSVSWENQSGTINGSSATTATATNKRKTGSLQIKKVVTGVGADLNQPFQFSVTLRNGNDGVSGKFGDIQFSNGIGTFSMKHNETKTIDGIPIGYSYSVSETSVPAYAASWENKDGTIKTSPTEVTCTNDLVRGDISFTKVDSETGKAMPGVAFRIRNTVTGESHVMMTDGNGVLSTASSAVRHTANTNANDAGVKMDGNDEYVDEEVVKATNGVWFHGSPDGGTTPDDSKGAMPYGTYEIEELRTTANRGYKMHAKFTFEVTQEGVKDLGKVDNNPPAPPVIPPEHGDTVTVYKDSEPKPNERVKPNDTITYTLLVRNTGKDACPRALVRDYVPEGTDFVSAGNGGKHVTASDQGSNGHGRGYVEWTVDDILPREERTVTFTVKVRQDVGQYVTNTGYVGKVDKTVEAGTPGNPEPKNESNTVMHPTTPKATFPYVRVIKTSVPAPGTEVAHMSEIEYTLHVENTGGTTATQVGVFDTVPTGTECSNLPDAYGSKLTQDKRGIGWLIPSLDPKASVDLKFTVTVTDREMARNSGVVRNQASWGDLSSNPSPSSPSSWLENTTNIVEHPLYMAPPETAETYKWSDPAPESTVKKGDTITYELTTTNTGSVTKPYVLVRDYIPEGTEYDNFVSDDGAYVPADASGNRTGRAYVEWVLSNVKVGDRITRTFKVKVTDDWRTYVRNHAYSETVSGPLTAGDPSNPEPKDTTNEVKHYIGAPANSNDKFPFVKVMKSSVPAPGTMVDLGRNITYTLEVENHSTAPAYDTRIFDAVPEGTTLVEAKDGSGYSVAQTDGGKGVGWLIPELKAGEKLTLEFVVRVTSKDVATINRLGKKAIRNQAKWDYQAVPSDGNAKVPTSDDGMENQTNIVEHPLLDPQEIQTGSQVTAYKDSEPKPNSVVKAGDEITYIINLTHTGTVMQEATIVRDGIPEGTTYIESSADNDGVFVGTDSSADGKAYVEWLIRDMKPGDQRRLSFKVKVTDAPPTFIRNMAIYDKADPSTTPGNPDNGVPGLHTNEVWHTTDENEPTPAVIQVVKAADPAPNTSVKIGDTIRYTLHVTNTGNSVATNWGVHDAIEEESELIDGTITTDHHGTVTNDGHGVAWVIESLEPGKSVDLSFSVKVTNRQIADMLVSNQATWGKRNSPDDIPAEPMENTSNIVEHPLVTAPAPVLTKTALTKGAVKTGDVVEFQITVKNDGDGMMSGYVLEDVPEKGLQLMSADHDGKMVDGKMTWEAVNLDVGEQFTAKVRCKVTTTTPGKLLNYAYLYTPSKEKLVAIGDADVIVISGVASMLVQTGITVTPFALAIGIGSIFARIGMTRRKDA